ncbi:MAG: peptide ABC transporter substrate-binding protein [Chloroflexi bacterium]|nr:peptide ABC transporter substrate-binding protein [Chloroflexota bacterium]
MHKRFLGILASLAVIVAACGGATSSSAPPASSVASGGASGAASAPASAEASASAGASESAAASESAGASASASAEASPSAGGGLAAEQILNVDIAGEPPTLDPNKAQDSNSITVLRALHRPLVYIDKDLQVVPALAESFDVSEDAKTLTFTLRDAKYSNGDPIVAGDLVYSWKRLIDPRTAAPYAYVMCEVEGAADALGVEAGCASGTQPTEDAAIDAAVAKLGIEAPDDKTFIVHLATPATYFLSAMTLWVGVPIQEKWITSEGATEAANYVSSGPFVLDTWEHNSEIVLKPNPNWYGDVKPTLTEIHMAMSPEPAQAMAAYEAGEIDMILPVPTEDVQRVKGDPTLADYSEQTGLSITQYDFNNGYKQDRCSDPKACPTANKNFRIALTQAIDKQAFIDATFAGLGQVANSFIMPGIPGYDESIDPYPYDPAAAQESMTKALAEIGVTSASELGPLKFGYNSGAGHEPRVAFLAEAWRTQFGLETEQIGSEFGVFLTQRTDGEYDLARDGWGADYPHGNNQLNGLFTCGGGNNNYQYCNKDFDALITQAVAEPDQDKQAELYKQAQTILMDDAAFLPLRFAVTPVLIRPYVGGLTLTSLDSQVPGEAFYETIQILEH